jgi:hypothetical protein
VTSPYNSYVSSSSYSTTTTATTTAAATTANPNAFERKAIPTYPTWMRTTGKRSFLTFMLATLDTSISKPFSRYQLEADFETMVPVKEFARLLLLQCMRFYFKMQNSGRFCSNIISIPCFLH